MTVRWVSRIALAIAALLALVAAGCSTTTQASTAEIRIGVNIELTGEYANLGLAYKRALEIRATQLNESTAAGGRRITLVVRDNKSDPEEAKRIARDLVDTSNVAAMIGPGTSPTTLPLVSFINERKIPTVSLGSSAAIVNPVHDRRYLFKTPANQADLLSTIVRDLRWQGRRSVAVLAVDNAYGDAGVAATEAAAAAGNVALADTVRFAAPTADFTDQVDELLEREPDAVLIWAVAPAASNIAAAINAAGYDGAVYFDPGAGSEAFLRDAGSSAEGMHMVAPSILGVNRYPATAPSALMQKEFYALYTQQHGSYSGFASYAADALGLLVAAAEKADSTDRERIHRELERLSYDGLTGTFEFTPEIHGGVSGDALAILTVRHGSWTPAQ